MHEIDQCDVHVLHQPNVTEGETHMISSKNVEKAFGKSQHAFMIKTL